MSQTPLQFLAPYVTRPHAKPAGRTRGAEMTSPEPNARLPYLRLYMNDHAARVGRLPLAVRGLLDLVRCELWSVEGAAMSREHLERRLMLPPDSVEATHLQTLIDARLLQVDERGTVSDEVLTRARADAIKQSDANRAAAHKRWARADGTTRGEPHGPPVEGDF